MKTILLLAFLLIAAPLCAAMYAGWAVGEADSGYGTIFATMDSGATWEQQGPASGRVAPMSTVSFARKPVPEPCALLALLVALMLPRKNDER